MKIIFRVRNTPGIFEVSIRRDDGGIQEIGIAGISDRLREKGIKISSSIADGKWCFKSLNKNSMCSEITCNSFKSLETSIATFYF